MRPGQDGKPIRSTDVKSIGFVEGALKSALSLHLWQQRQAASPAFPHGNMDAFIGCGAGNFNFRGSYNLLCDFAETMPNLERAVLFPDAGSIFTEDGNLHNIFQEIVHTLKILRSMKPSVDIYVAVYASQLLKQGGADIDDILRDGAEECLSLLTAMNF